MMQHDTGGPAFSCVDHMGDGWNGMTLLDWFAGQVQADDRLVKCIRAMDDEALKILGDQVVKFAIWPGMEREEWITETESGMTPCDWSGLSQVQKIYHRLIMEAKALAVCRYLQAAAMIAEKRRREATPPSDELGGLRARVATLEEEIVESRIEIDARRLAWDGLQKNPSRPDSPLLDIATKILHQYADRVDAARSATGPIGGAG